eukprot:SAG31_NODE_8154_length_1507_cov_8.022416_2_plen_52_part_01
MLNYKIIASGHPACTGTAAVRIAVYPFPNGLRGYNEWWVVMGASRSGEAGEM